MGRIKWARLTVAICIVVAGAGYALTASRHKAPGLSFDADQQAALRGAIALMRTDGLSTYADLADKLMTKGIWQLARPEDGYMKDAERSGDEPFAYTLSGGHQPSAIVLAPRFFDSAYEPADRAALMVHEMGHYLAYVKTGRSTEYDGYKAEYDSNTKLGLSSGLVYFAMLDGVQMYVVPIDASYAKKPDVADYIKNPG